MMKSKTMVFAAFMLICLSIMNPLCGGQRVFAEEKKDYLKIGFRLMREEALGNLAVGISDSAVNQQMGEAEKKSEPKVWAADGYVQVAYALQLAQDAGFKLAAQSEINANPKDTKDHPFGVWTLPPTRLSAPRGQPARPGFDHTKFDAIGESDRMTLKLLKPK